MSQPTGIAARLKSSTAELHRMAERRPLQRRLVRGQLPRSQYAAFLGQMYLVHRALEGRIDSALPRHAALPAVMRDHYRRVDHLRRDLAFLGTDPDAVEALPATRALVEAIDGAGRDDPVALLGMLYVLEGSTNGSKMIARALRGAYGLEPGPGLSYLDPHGDRQRQRWSEFKRDLDAAALEPREAAAVVEAARTVFARVAEISDELIEPETATV